MMKSGNMTKFEESARAGSGVSATHPDQTKDVRAFGDEKGP
jgi:hypothetical protein